MGVNSKGYRNNFRSLFLIISLILLTVLTACGSGEAEPAKAIGEDTGTLIGDAEDIEQSADEESSSDQQEEKFTDLNDIANHIAENYGTVTNVVDKGSDAFVIIFPENHASMLQRLEIAIMLNRLYAHYDLRHLGLEGWMADDAPMDLSPAHRDPAYIPGNPVTSREDVLAHMLKKGAFSSIEFMGLIYEDAVVNGIDDEVLYAKTIPDEVRYVPFDFLYAIAIAEMSEADIAFWSDLINDNDIDRAFEFAILSNDYTAEMMDSYGFVESTEEQIALLEEIKNKADTVNAELYPDEADKMETLIQYSGVVSARSGVFVESILNHMQENPGESLAIEIGYSHTNRVETLLGDADISFATVYPNTYYLEEDPSLLSLEAYARKEAGLSPSPEGTIGNFLRGRMPPPNAWDLITMIELGFIQFAQSMQQLLMDYPDIENYLQDYEFFEQWPEEAQEDIIERLNASWEVLVNGVSVGPGLHLSIDQTWEFKLTDITTNPFNDRLAVEFEIRRPGDEEWVGFVVTYEEHIKNLIPLEELMEKMHEAFIPEIPADSIPAIPQAGDFYPACSTTFIARATGE